MTDRVVVMSQKGGVGKTTVTLNLGLALAERGKRTLIVDMDPQGGIGLSLARPDTEWRGLVDVLVGAAQTSEVLVRTHEQRLTILPRGRLDPVDVLRFEQVIARPDELESVIAQVEQEFDYVLLDAPSGLGAITRAALSFAAWALVVFKADPLSVRSIQQALRVIDHVSKEDNANLKLLGILPTMVELTKDFSQSSLVALWSGFGGVFDTMIPKTDALGEASQLGLPLSYVGGSAPPEVRRFEALATEVESITEALHRRETDVERPRRALV